MRRLVSIFTTVFGLSFLAPLTVQACSCFAAGAPCQAFWNSSAVFSAEVQKVNVITPERVLADGTKSYGPRRREVFVSVIEAFSGLSAEKAVQINTGGGGGDCGYDFQEGRQYLIYAYKNPQTGALSTGICTRTQLLEKATADLEYLRSLPTAKPGSTIYGKVVQRYVRKEDEPYREPKPLENIRLTLEKTGGGKTIEIRTDVEGAYRLENLTSGEYKIRIDTPAGLWGGSGESKVMVFDKGCAASYFVLETNTQLSGRILDKNSQPVEMSVQLVPVDQVNNRAQKNLQMSYTDKNGFFSFRSIPSGTYYLGVRLFRIAEPNFPYPRTFYPGTTNSEKAKAITINEGQVIENFDFKLPSKLSVRRVEGVVVYPDGSPAPNAMIGVQETEYAEGSMGYILATSKVDGTFSLTLMDGLRYLLKPVVSATDTPSRQRHAEPIEIPAKGGVTNLKFVITEPNGNCEKCLRWSRSGGNKSTPK